MKLTIAQWLWMSAVFLMFATVLLDVVEVMNIRPIYWTLGFGILMPIGWWVMPSMKEIKAHNGNLKRK